jgi:hypothetical protein
MASKKRFSWNWLLMALAVLIFFLGSIVLINDANIYVSPDETANAYFVNSFVQDGTLNGPTDALSAQLGDRIHPRSTVSFQGTLLPGSFLGLPVIYGLLSVIMGSWALFIFTPLITLLAAYAWGKMVTLATKPSIGKLSFGLFLLHPAIWYYTARGLMHNVLFVDLLVLSAWFWIVRPMKPSKQSSGVWDDIFAGLMLGLALFVRTSEVLWIAIAVVMAAVIWRKTLSWRRIRSGLFGLAIGLALLFGMNALVYGHPLTTGYTIGSIPIEQLDIADSVDSVELLPFGFHPMNAWRHALSYAVIMFWWLSLLALPGIAILLSQKRHKRTVRWAMALATAVSIWLIVMYGSWEIHDNPDPTQITMANSYIRYWLPLYIFSTPMIAATILWVTNKVKSKILKKATLAIFILAILGLNINAVFIQGQDGLLSARAELNRSNEIQASVLASTQVDSIIIVDRADKLFFPHRRIWYPLRDDATYNAMPTLVADTTLYYYGITFPESDLDYLNEVRLEQMNLQIKLIQTYDQESLYQIF